MKAVREEERAFFLSLGGREKSLVFKDKKLD
jgi:hypothetical protein